MLSGYKTYIMGSISILTEVGLYLTGGATLQDALAICIPAVLAMTVRHGISTTAAK